MKKYIFLKIASYGFVVFIAGLIYGISLETAFADNASTPSRDVKDIPWDQRTWHERAYDSRYEDHFTFKHGKPYVLDPWTWGYTKEFAERFRMPDKWIEPELKGALAVAWRMTTIGDTNCGMGQREESCWKPLNCQLDVYYDNKIELPWIRPEVVRDNRMPGLTSSRFLTIPPKQWPPEEKGGPGGGIRGFEHGKFNQGIAMIVNFDREFQPGVGLISWMLGGVCPPQYTGSEKVVMKFNNQEDVNKFRDGKLAAENIRIGHTIEFPQSFLRRAKALYELQNKSNNDVMDSLIKQFFDSRKSSQPSPLIAPNAK